MNQSNYLVYHNPATMDTEFSEISQSGRVGTNKESTAENAANEDAIIWCVGKKGEKGKRYFLYQRIVGTSCSYAKKAEIEDGDFKITLSGKPTLPIGYEKDITDEPYFAELKKLLSLGLQKLGTKNQQAIEDFKAEYQRTLT